MEKIDNINFCGRRLENNQNLRLNEAVSKLRSHARRKKAGRKGSTSDLVMNSYLNDNVEDAQFYFSLVSFSTKRNLNLGSKLRSVF